MDLFNRGTGDIETAVVNLVRRLAQTVPPADQPNLACKIAEIIARRPNTMSNNMFLRQSIICGRTAPHSHVVNGLASWITVLFDLDNLQHNRLGASDLKTSIPERALDRLRRAQAGSQKGCILAVPHIGGIELFKTKLSDWGFDVNFVYAVSEKPTPLEQWIFRGRSTRNGTPIPFGRKNTVKEIANILDNNGVVLMVVDVYPSAKYKGIRVNLYDDQFNYPPGPARFAERGTLVLPAFASRRYREGFSIDILDPIDYRASLQRREARVDFTQRLANQITAFTVERPDAYWLWHPIPNDPYLAIARRKRPELLEWIAAQDSDDEAVALTVEAFLR